MNERVDVRVSLSVRSKVVKLHQDSLFEMYASCLRRRADNAGAQEGRNVTRTAPRPDSITKRFAGHMEDLHTGINRSFFFFFSQHLFCGSIDSESCVELGLPRAVRRVLLVATRTTLDKR